MLNRIFRKLNNAGNIFLALLIFLSLFFCGQASAADRLYFVSIAEQPGHAARIISEWGPMEGEIPATISEFKLYRSEDGGPHKPVATTLGKGRVANALVSAGEIRTIVDADPDTGRTAELLNRLELIRQGTYPGAAPITVANFQDFLHELLDPTSKAYDPLRRMLLIRAFPAAAQASGLAFVDDTVVPGRQYQYLLTAVTASGESLPIGQSASIDPARETVLPAPNGFQQIRVAGCSELRKNLDDDLIHFNWDIPMDPSMLGLKIQTYGYDIFWSENPLSTPDFRTGIPAGAYKVNDTPILASGPAASEGPDSFLAKDDGSSHLNGPQWKRGQEYYYYLVARDLAGHYSETAKLLDSSNSEIPAIVVDTLPPKAPWNIHTEELNSDKTSPFVPATPTIQQLALVWDQVNPVNYVRYYGSNKNICGMEDGQVCYTKGADSCSDPAKVRCADLEVDHYDVYRFDSPEEASHWGLDTDGDMWPDALEDTLGYDKCLDTSPGSVPLEHVATIAQNSGLQRQLAETHTQMYFVDTAIRADNIVRWYRVIAVDSLGNQSSISPPIRGVLYDREQPKVNAGLYTEDCTFSTDKAQDCGFSAKDNFLNLVNSKDQDAKSFGLYQYCEDVDYPEDSFTRELLFGAMSDLSLETPITTAELTALYGSTPPSCGIGKPIIDPKNPGRTSVRVAHYFGRFFDADRKILSESGPFGIETFGQYTGCITLNKSCKLTFVTPGIIPTGHTEVCVDLKAGESARLYHLNADGMTPFRTIEPVYTPRTSCENVDDLPGIVASDLCLGVRVFSDNHVGSGIKYLDCLELEPLSHEPPEAPSIEAVDSTQTPAKDPQFTLRWAAAGEGLSAFLIEWSHESEDRYETTWDIKPNDLGQYQFLFDLKPEDLNKKWCFKVKAVNSAMQTSDWSAEKCGTWEFGEPANLPWPPVAEPQEVSDINAVYMAEQVNGIPYGLPAIILSDDLTDQLDQIGSCSSVVPECGLDKGQQSCLRTDRSQTQYSGDCSGICELLSSAAYLKNFIVYRQETGHDFVQVSPLLEGFNCTLNYKDKYPIESFAVVDDPFVLLVNRKQITLAGGTQYPVIGGVRLIFQDRYPHSSGLVMRYKVLAINADTGEIDKVHTTNWIVIP